MEVICKTLDDTKVFAQKFAKAVENRGCFVSLYGEIGAGKTAFVKKLADMDKCPKFADSCSHSCNVF